MPSNNDDWEKFTPQSTMIVTTRYSPSRRELVFQFKNGSEYTYLVPPGIFDSLKQAGSAGKFYKEVIVPHFFGNLTSSLKPIDETSPKRASWRENL